MKFSGVGPLLTVLVGVGTLLAPEVTRACAVCFGDPESPMTDGINLAILTLVGVTGSVLGGFVAFFLHLRKRARLFSRPKPNGKALKLGG